MQIFEGFESLVAIRRALWIVMLCLLTASHSIAFSAESPTPPLVRIDTNFGGATFGLMLHQKTPDLLRLIGLEAGQEASPIQPYQKAALLEFFQGQKAYRSLPQGDALYPKFLKLLDFLKAHKTSSFHDNDPALLQFLRETGLTVQDMNDEFAQQLDLQINLGSGLLQCILTANSLGSVTVYRNKIVVEPFTTLDGDLPVAVASKIPDQVLALLDGDNPQQKDATCQELATMRGSLAANSHDQTISTTALPPLVRLEYLYDSATSVLTMKAGTRHTVSDVAIFRYDATGSDGLTRKRDIERLLRDQLQNREVNHDEVNKIVRKVVGNYLGHHKHPQPSVLRIGYETDPDDLSGLVSLDIIEGPYVPRPIALSGGIETDVPSGRFTERASLAHQNLFGRGITLTASGSTGGEDGASLQLSAPSDIFRNREWQFGAESARLSQIRLANGQFTEQRNLLEFSLPISSVHPPTDAPVYARYFSTGYRYRVGQYELTSSAAGTRQRYTVGVLGFSWRRDIKDYWAQPPIPRQLLDANAPPLARTGRFPFQIDVDAGSKLLGGDQYFFRALLEARTHLALSPRWLLAVRASAAWSSSSTPTLEQPALGGDSPPALLRSFNPEYFRGRQVGSGTVEFRYFTTDDVAITVGGDTGIADGGAAPSHGIKTGLVAGVYWLKARPLGGQSLGLFWASGAGASRWSLALTSGF